MDVKVKSLPLTSRPCHRATIVIAEDDGDAESAYCNCGATWDQTEGPLDHEWYWTHVAPDPILTGTLLRARAVGR
jgi:hypothetical protein